MVRAEISEEKYRGGGLFSVTSKILVNDLLSAYTVNDLTAEGNVPVDLITGIVILHAETWVTV